MKNAKSLKQKILDYLIAYDKHRPKEWLNGGEVERLALVNGYKASNASRRCRELVTEGAIERSENFKGYVMYRAIKINI